MSSLQNLKKELRSVSTPQRAKALAWFFKTGPGQYGEGDIFIGITVPENRRISKKYNDLSLNDVEALLQSKEHEFRLSALIILVHKFKNGSAAEQKQIFDLYLANAKWINNWDLVDASAEYIVGEYLYTKSKKILDTLAKSQMLWERRIAMIATFAYIKKGESEITIKIAEKLLHDKHDLIQKAVGWMLREMGKRASLQAETDFLNKHAATMPRTTLRYAIERFTPEQRFAYMNYAKLHQVN